MVYTDAMWFSRACGFRQRPQHTLSIRQRSCALSPAARAATFAAGDESDHPVCHAAIAVRPNWAGCNGSPAFLIIMIDLGLVVVRCPRHGATHSVQWVRRVAHESRVLFVALLHNTVASLRIRSDRNVLYIRIQSTLISQTRSDTYIWFSQ